MRDKVIGKAWIYLGRNTFHRLRAISVGERPWEKHSPQTEHGPAQKVRGPKIWHG